MILMKKISEKIKEKFPLYKEKFINSLDILLIYQGILFLLAPTGINQLLLIALVLIFILLIINKI